MSIFLITDFGLSGPYTGQVLHRLAREAPGVPAYSLFADAPAFDPRRAAYLVAAYGQAGEEGDVFLCVVDPGVGTDRAGLALLADGRWYVGPDNGLLAVAGKQARQARWWRLPPPPPEASKTFHGRDWFAPMAARIARGEAWAWLEAAAQAPVGSDWPEDLPQVVYIDHYGNAMTGLRAARLDKRCRLRAGGVTVPPARMFAQAPPGAAFWYENANGLAEIAVNQGRASQSLGLAVGSPLEIV